MNNVIKTTLLGLTMLMAIAANAAGAATGVNDDTTVVKASAVELVAARIAPFLSPKTGLGTFASTSKATNSISKKQLFLEHIKQASKLRQIQRAMIYVINNTSYYPRGITETERLITEIRPNLNKNALLHYAVMLSRPAIDHTTTRSEIRTGRAERNYNLIRLLIRNGADVNFANKEGKTPLDLSLEIYRGDIAALLIELGATCSLKQRLKILELRCEEAGFPIIETATQIATIGAIFFGIKRLLR